MTNDEPQFGIDDCTCIPFTRQTNPSRYLNRPTDTVDMISGWERGRDCPHHAPVVPVSSPPPDQTALRDRIAAVLREHYLSTNRNEADADGNLPCRCGAWREPGVEVDDENDWDSHLADAALAVLPPTADRAAVLQWAADDLAEFIALHGPTSRTVAGWRGAIGFLRRLAAEAQQPDTETQACAHPDGCDGECPCPPSCGCCTVTAAPDTEMPNTDRAAVYREVADRLTTDAHGMQPDWARIYKRDAANKVREWAAEMAAERQKGAETRVLADQAVQDRAILARVRRLYESGPLGTCCAHLVGAALSGPGRAAATPEQPPAHKGGNADDCPACQAQGLHTIGHPYECPGSEK